jgi:holo-[acyl-carrier protein] synthase
LDIVKPASTNGFRPMSIHGIGTDIVSIERIRAALARHEERFARKVLSDAELTRYTGLKDGAAYVAKRFAAKEAFFKALGEPSSSANTWHQLSVINDSAGKPALQCGALLHALLEQKNISSAHVSLSDEREHAVAFVILEKEKQ